MKAGWVVRPLEELADIGAGNPAPQDKLQFENGTYPFFRTSDVGQIRFGEISTSVDLLNERGADGLRLVPAGTVLLPKSGASTFLNHRVITRVDGYVSSHLATITARDEVSEPRYLLYALAQVRAQDLLPENSYPSLNLSLVKSIKLPLPPLEEQRRIVAVLDEAFEGLARARAHAEANLQNARELYGRCRDGLLEHGNEWEELPLGDLLESITYGFTNPMPDAEDGPFKITAKNVTGGRIDYANARRTTVEAFNELLTDKSRPQIGDVLLTKDGTLGRTAVVDQGNICINQSVAVMRTNSRVLPDYLAELLACSTHQDAMVAGAGGATIKHLYITRVPKITVEIPEIAEQIKLLEALEALRSCCRAVEDAAMVKLQSLDTLRQSLLQEAFAGELT